MFMVACYVSSYMHCLLCNITKVVCSIKCMLHNKPNLPYDIEREGERKGARERERSEARRAR